MMMLHVSITESIKIFLVFAVWLTILGAVCYAAARVLRVNKQDPGPIKPSAGVYDSLASYVIFVIAGTMAFILYRSLRNSLPSAEFVHLKAWHLMFPTISGIAAILPPLMFMRWRRQSLATAGMTRNNLWSSMIMSAIFLLGVSLLDDNWSNLTKLEPRHWVNFAYYALVGLQEEFLFRGFIQTRMVARFGSVAGWLLTGLLFSYAHITTAMLGQNMSFADAVVSCTAYLPIGLFWGFVVLKTGNIMAAVPSHVVLDFLNNLK